ncbi:uncharacterized protein BDR25DRAFT_263691 [Lindgomyces ingoldianus]|uniref:Uncharacterized protein n=1 Tax=Lindgomyces ingoldianus TaxID=673940 RepID=A0ACB6QQQ1_9PLEO|nr:uncharacterized protein BDR25DRAFT_263691 [Lindgomyces ingoldianus]KAF2469241.1 hypothetical protein BDR25DRAFT_263691 [Lindgomyces ingoldianus]
MEEIEQPPVEKAPQGRTSQACQRCRNLKTRCYPSERAGTCQRCLSSTRECVWPETPRRAKRLRGPSRISQVEQKIDGLFASLVQTEPPRRAPANAEPSSEYKPCEGQLRERPLAPGSWLPFPSSFTETQRNDHDTETQRNDHDTETQMIDRDAEGSQEFLEKLRKIHNFVDHHEPRPPPGTLFQASTPLDPVVEHKLVRDLLSSGEADVLLNEYRSMLHSFPFVPIPPTISAQELSSRNPMLFLAILTATSSKDHQRQLALDEQFRIELANRTIIRPHRTLSLVQSIIVYLSWYHFVFSHKTHQIFSLIQLAIGVALDIGLHQKQGLSFFEMPGRPKPPSPSPSEARERQRAFLGCYYLSSAIAGGLHKPNLLKYTDYMAEACRCLRNDAEYSIDEIIGQLISLRRIDDQIHDTFFTEEAAQLPITDSRVLMNLRFVETQIEEWRRETQREEHPRVLDLSCSYTMMQLHSIGLRSSQVSSEHPFASPTQLNALSSTLEAGKSFLDALIAIPASEYHLITFPEWMRLPFVVMTITRLCIPSEAHTATRWDVKAAQDRVRLDLCLESLCYRMQSLSTFEKRKQPHPDFWWAMRMIMELIKGWYCRKIRVRMMTSAQLTPNELPTPDTIPNFQGSLESSRTCQTPLTVHDGVHRFPQMALNHVDLGTGNLDVGNEYLDPFAFMMDKDFDMDKFFDMGIWGTGTYEEMGFGGGNMRD